MTATERMREAAAKGGAKTKAKAANDPGYYSRIGKLGGRQGAGKKRKSSKRKQRKPSAEKKPQVHPKREAASVPQSSAPDILDAILGGR